jgi:hypothetical protein
VGADHEDQAAGEEFLGGYPARGCHAAGRPNGVGRYHQRGATGDVGIAGSEGYRHKGMGGGQVLADRQQGYPEREGAAAEDGVRLGSLVTELDTLGEVIKEQQVVQKLLRVIPKHLSQVAVTIEVTQDLSKLKLEDVGGRLCAAEDRVVEDDALPPPRVNGKLLLTEEQWKEKSRQRSDAGQGSYGGGEHHRCPRKRGNGRKKGAQCDDKCQLQAHQPLGQRLPPVKEGAGKSDPSRG